MKIAIFASIAMLSGCATCHDHRSLCAVGAATLATSIALSIRTTHQEPVTRRPLFCGASGQSCK